MYGATWMLLAIGSREGPNGKVKTNKTFIRRAQKIMTGMPQTEHNNYMHLVRADHAFGQGGSPLDLGTKKLNPIVMSSITARYRFQRKWDQKVQSRAYDATLTEA